MIFLIRVVFERQLLSCEEIVPNEISVDFFRITSGIHVCTTLMVRRSGPSSDERASPQA